MGCNIASGPKVAFHVPFRYTSDVGLITPIKNEEYDLDGIEGYVYDPNGSQPPGTQMLCSRRTTARHDRILVFDPAGTCGAGSPSTDPHAIGFDGSGYNDGGGAGEKIGYAYPVQRPKALPDQPLPAAQSFNGDQYADIFWMHSNGASSSVWLQDGATTLPSSAAATGQTITSDWKVAAIADFDGDGKADRLWRGIGGAHVGKTRLWVMSGTTVISSSDFDGDGKADILWRHNNGSNAMWFMDGFSIKSGQLVGPADTGYSVQPVIP